ncbi:MAG: TIGR00730 family Rossman fold protein, partial [Anaerolineae bacterium]|nr:TIGR00730 family Rossman fold protein [Anaerolineae bacterium]
EKGAYTIGVIPQMLVDRELQHRGLNETHVVDTMHERKWGMAERADAFVALPGGFGTYEELFEVITWAQLGFHHKPIVLLNTADYFAPFTTITRHGVEEGFIRPIDTTLLMMADTVEEVFEKLKTYMPPKHTPKGMKLDQI